MPSLDQVLAAAPAFAGLEPAQLELIAGCAGDERAESGAYLLREGERADRFFLIASGKVALEVHAPGRGGIVIETLGAGDVVGWSWLFAPYRWHLDGRATEPCALVAFDAACLRARCDADHELGYRLMSHFAAIIVDRLQATRLQLLDVYGHADISA